MSKPALSTFYGEWRRFQLKPTLNAFVDLTIVVSTREFVCVDGTIVKSFSKLRYEENGGEMLAFLPLNT